VVQDPAALSTDGRERISTVTQELVSSERKLPRGMHLQRSIVIPRSRAEVFYFLTHGVSQHYRAMSPGHECFEVKGGGPVRADSTIVCRERMQKEEVHHLYRVRAFAPGRHLHYASLPSRTFIHLKRRVIEGHANTHVYYDLHDQEGGTRLDMLIVIQLPHLLQKWMAQVTGSQRLWSVHQQDELERMRELMLAA